MKLQRATFLGVRGVADGSYDFSDPVTGAPHEIVVVTGAEASGKTRFLEAILATKEAIGPYGPMSPGATWLLPGSPTAKVILSFVLDAEERDFVGTSQAVVDGEATFLRDRARRDADEGLVALLQRYEHGRESGKVEYFPANRRLSPQGPFHGTGVLEQRMQRGSKEPTKYGFVVRFLRELSERPVDLDRFAKIVERLSPHLRYVAREPAPGLPRCFSSRGGPASTLTEISETEAHVVLVAATAVAIGLDRSLVLLDRPELLASPERAAPLLAALGELGNGHQLLLATSCREIVNAAPRNSVIVLEGV